MDKETRIKDFVMLLTMKYDRYDINKTIVEIKEEIEKLEEENDND